MNVSLNCTTFNVGQAPDFVRLMAKLNPKLSAAESYKQYEVNLEDKIPKLIEGQDFVCLQEYGMDCRHYLVREVFEKNKFTVVSNDRLGIAFRSDRFKLLKDGPTFTYDPHKLTPWQYDLTAVTDMVASLRPSYYADLRHIESGSIVRVVSAHFKGFNVKAQKEMKAKIRNIEKTFATRLGDLEVDALLYSLIELPGKQPTITVIGVDSNTTLKNNPSSHLRIHSKRLMKLINAGFFTYTADNAPTIFDNADGAPRKYDHILAHVNAKITEWELCSYPVFQLTEKNPSDFISDHVPVKGFISYTIEE